MTITPYQVPLPVAPVLSPTSTDATTDYYNLNMTTASGQVVPGKTLTNDIRSHGLSDQLTVPLVDFEAALSEAGFELDRRERYLFPNDRAAATISVNHLRAR